jgi:tripartite-type tricarboxylate transporter receptor subunit TctC
MFKAMSGIRMVHVPYRGSTIELGDLVAGRIEMAFDPLPSSLDYIRDGRLKALAVTSLARSEIIPDTPTVASFLPGYEANVWVGLSAPRALPAAIVQRLNTEINAVLSEPAFRKRMTDLGVSPLILTPDGFGKLIADDTDKWTKVITAAGIKAE